MFQRDFGQAKFWAGFSQTGPHSTGAALSYSGVNYLLIICKPWVQDEGRRIKVYPEWTPPGQNYFQYYHSSDFLSSCDPFIDELLPRLLCMGTEVGFAGLHQEGIRYTLNDHSSSPSLLTTISSVCSLMALGKVLFSPHSETLQRTEIQKARDVSIAFSPVIWSFKWPHSRGTNQGAA